MAIAERNLLYGTTLDSCAYRPSGNTPRLFFRDKSLRQSFGIDERSVFRNILLAGCAGSGKTTIINQVFSQVRDWNSSGSRDGISIIFDTKGDYYSHREFFRYGDYLIGNDLRFRNRSDVWNIFAEVLADGNAPECYEPNAREIASILFKDRGSVTQPFFANAARDIFASMLIYFIRRSRDNPSQWAGMLNNFDFITFMLKHEPPAFAEFFRIYDDMKGLLTYIGDGVNNQSLGVFGELRSMIYDCFQGVFRMKPSSTNSSFSIRNAVRNKGGRAIFIMYDLSLGEIMSPMYRLLVDLALKEALSENANGHTHVFLDELKLIPKLTHLEDALNFGREKQVSITAGIQSVSQIYSIYGEDAARVILSGFGNNIILRTSDYETREYASKLFGPNYYSYKYYSESSDPIYREREGRTVEHWDLQRLERPGQAIVSLSSQSTPFLFDFNRENL